MNLKENVLDGLAYASLPESVLVAKVAASFTGAVSQTTLKEALRATCPVRGSFKRLFDALLIEHKRQIEIRRKRRTLRPITSSLQGLARLRERNAETTRSAVAQAYNRCGYRRSQSSWAGGGHELIISVGGLPAVHGGSEKVWSSNGKWSGSNSTHRITVSCRWRSTLKTYPTGTITVNRKELLIVAITDDHLLVAKPGAGFELNLAIVQP